MLPNEQSSFSIATIAQRVGVAVDCEANSPVKLNDVTSVWYVETGTVDLFLYETEDGTEQTSPQHLLRAQAGWLIPGVADDRPGDGDENTQLSLIGKGIQGTRLRKLSTNALEQVNDSILADLIDLWISTLTDALTRFVTRAPRATDFVDADTQSDITTGTLSVRRGVVWLPGLSQGASLFMGVVNCHDISKENEQVWIPITKQSWITIFEDVAIESQSSLRLLQKGQLFGALNLFHRIALRKERLNRRLAIVDEANLDRDRSVSRRIAEEKARSRLLDILVSPADIESSVYSSSLVSALKIIGKHLDAEFEVPIKLDTLGSQIRLADVLDQSSLRTRRVNLGSKGTWWKNDGMVLLAFRSIDDQPVVLIPSTFGHYRQIDPITKKTSKMSAARAAELKDSALMFYKPLPEDILKPRHFWRYAMHGSGSYIVNLIIGGLLGASILLVPVFLFGIVANQLEEGSRPGIIFAAAIALVLVGIIGAMLQFLQSLQLLRFKSRITTQVEAAFWDRLLRLPRAVLQHRSSGDLAASAMTFQKLRDQLADVVANGLSSIFLIVSVCFVIFLFDFYLGIISVSFVVITTTLSMILVGRQILPHGKILHSTRLVTGLLFEIVSGITKIRVERAEGSVFARWANEYRELKDAELHLEKLERHTKAFGTVLPYLATALIFSMVSLLRTQPFSVGQFLVLFLFFMTLQLVVVRFGESISSIASLIPSVRQMQPILTAVPEAVAQGDPVGHLRGDVVFDKISFRYDSDGPLILDDVTIHARPGEFVAIAGESGAGKSTLFQLALGLEKPTAGAVYFDGRDLRHLNLKQLRKNIGAVPQSVRLHPNDIWDNIVTHHDEVRIEQVWQATRDARIEDEIKDMPMGIMTMVGTSGSVLSGGESQRVTIARSLLGKPKILLFDEATNWLDNKSQMDVMENLALLTSTRIVIAHRLSTLEKADRIYVMKAGRVVQCGSFDELVEVEGVFQDLIKRQLV